MLFADFVFEVEDTQEMYAMYEDDFDAFVQYLNDHEVQYTGADLYIFGLEMSEQ